jgi:hypothetical protein
MSYRRVRSYQRRDARQNRNLPVRSRPGRVPTGVILAAALVAGVAGIGTLSAPHIKAMLAASAKADKPRPAMMAEGVQASGGLHGVRTAKKAEGMLDACNASNGDTMPGTAQCPSATPTANVNCDIIVPQHPLTATGLATPYRLTGPGGASPEASGCTMANAANLGAFVQATILDPASGKLWVYEPLVITKGTRPAAPPVVPKLPKGAVVTIDFGFNGDTLTQVGGTPRALKQGHCDNGMRGSPYGQVSFCHGTHFFWAARRAERQGKLSVPSAGVSPKTGQACPTTRSFTVIDQDQSDNVTTQYLLTASGRTAQFNKSNAAAMTGASTISNGSDNVLLDDFLDPALGCTPFTAPDLSQGGAPGTSQALDELSAARSQAAPVALVPENDPMVMVNGALNATKTNHYRAMVGQPDISSKTDATDSPANYCQNMINIQTRFLSNHEALLSSAPSPVPAVGNNLLSFMANRLIMSYVNLSCQKLGVQNPVKVSFNSQGVATSVTFG